MTALCFLEWGLALSGAVAFALALVCLHDAIAELHAVRAAGVNGRYLAAARHHLWRSVFRAVPAILSCGAGVWLLMQPDVASAVDVVAKTCWLVYQVAMISNLLIETWARSKVKV